MNKLIFTFLFSFLLLGGVFVVNAQTEGVDSDGDNVNDEIECPGLVDCPDGGLVGTPAWNNINLMWIDSDNVVSSLDYDSDGVQNSSDNCLFSVNPSQLDSDGDGIGDVCDTDSGNNPNAIIAGSGLTSTGSSISFTVQVQNIVGGSIGVAYATSYQDITSWNIGNITSSSYSSPPNGDVNITIAGLQPETDYFITITMGPFEDIILDSSYANQSFSFSTTVLGESDTTTPSEGSSEIQNPIQFNSIPALIVAVLDFLVKIGFPLVVVAIIYSGFLFIFARGNESKLETAKKALQYAVVGGVLILGAWMFANMLQEMVGDVLSFVTNIKKV